MAVQSGKGGIVIWESSATEAGDYTAWATSTAYGIDDEVTTGSGATTRFFRALQDHTSSNTNQPPTGAGTPLPAGAMGIWREVARGQISALSTWSLDEQSETATFSVLDEDTARTLSTTTTATGQIVVGYEPNDIVQQAMTVGSTGVMEIRQRGTGSGNPRLRFNANITSRNEAGEDSPQVLTIGFGVSGSIDRSNQA